MIKKENETVKLAKEVKKIDDYWYDNPGRINDDIEDTQCTSDRLAKKFGEENRHLINKVLLDYYEATR